MFNAKASISGVEKKVVFGYEWTSDCIIMCWALDGAGWVTGAVNMKLLRVAPNCVKNHLKNCAVCNLGLLNAQGT